MTEGGLRATDGVQARYFAFAQAHVNTKDTIEAYKLLEASNKEDFMTGLDSAIKDLSWTSISLRIWIYYI